MAPLDAPMAKRRSATPRRSASRTSRKQRRRRGKGGVHLTDFAAPAWLLFNVGTKAVAGFQAAGLQGGAVTAVDELADQVVGKPVFSDHPWDPSKPLTLLGIFLGGKAVKFVAQKTGINRAMRSVQTGRKVAL